MKKADLYYKEGSSDKEYHIQLEKSGDLYVVNFQYGRRGSTLKPGTKTKMPVSLESAEKIYNSVLREKLSEGYTEGGTVAGFSGAAVQSKEIYILPQLLNKIEDEDVQKYIDDDDYVGQEKKDGERRMVEATDKFVRGTNKLGMEVQLPTSIIESIFDNCTIDGEIIGEKLFVFDILSLIGRSLTEYDYTERLQILDNLLWLGAGIEVVKTAFTKKEKQQMYDDLKKNNKEGMVFKLKKSKYRPGRPASLGDHLKNKFYKTATFIVSDLTTDKRSVGLEIISGNERVAIGKVTIPPNKEIPSVGSFVEVRYLYAYRGGSIYQPIYLHERTDCDLSDATIVQIVYKAEN